MAVVIDQPVADFQAQATSGTSVFLAALRGQQVLIYFYPKDSTPGCTAEACNLRDGYSQLRKQGYEVIGVSVDDEKSHQKFISKYELPFDLISDTEKKIVEDYGVWGEKSMYGKSYMGIDRSTYLVGKDGKVAAVWRKVKVKDHAAEVLAAAKGL